MAKKNPGFTNHNRFDILSWILFDTLDLTKSRVMSSCVFLYVEMTTIVLRSINMVDYINKLDNKYLILTLNGLLCYKDSKLYFLTPPPIS